MNVERSIVIVPAYRSIEHETDAELRLIEKLGIRVERFFGNSAIDQARSLAASWMLTRPQGYEDIYWIDSDIHFELSDFHALVEGPMFGCLPYQTKMPHGGIAVLPLEGEDVDSSTRGMKELRACGFGFVKTHRSIFEAMSSKVGVCQNSPGARPLWPFFQPSVWKLPDMSGRSCYYGEDYSFCLRARELGFKLFGNFDRNLGHIGRYAYRIGESF